MPFELPPWLQETGKPFQSFAQGAQIGLAISQRYAQARQFQQQLDLQQRQLVSMDAQRNLQNTIVRTKLAHDQDDYNTINDFVPIAANAKSYDELSKLSMPVLHDTQNYLKFSALLDQRKTEKALGELGGALSKTTDWADPSVYRLLNEWVQKAPDIALLPVFEHLRQRNQEAVKAKNTLAGITAYRNQQFEVAKQKADAATSRALTYELNSEDRLKIDQANLRLNQMKADSTVDVNDVRVLRDLAEIDSIEQKYGLRTRELEQLTRRNDLAEKKFETALTPLEKKNLDADFSDLKRRTAFGDFRDPKIRDRAEADHAEQVAVAKERIKINAKYEKLAEPAPTGKAAAPGYSIGQVYKGGLKYLGGDPNSEGSWEKVQ